MSFADIASSKGVEKKISLEETVALKLEQFQRQVAVVSRASNRSTSDVSSGYPEDLQERIRFACLLQEEVAKHLACIPNENAMQKKKLYKDFETISKNFEKAVKIIQQKEHARQEELVKKSVTVEHNGEVIQFKKLESEIAHNEVLIEEREREIIRIHQSVGQVNEIFKDLANLVKEQQTTIDDIESHIQESHARTKQGLEQVEKAAAAQRTCTIQ